MVNYLLLSHVESILGKGKKTSKGNYAFFCPFGTHSKPKLEINFSESEKGENPWGCWVCAEHKGKKLYNLFKKINTPQNVLEDIKKLTKYTSDEVVVSNATLSILTLPKEFRPLADFDNKNITANQAMSYLKSRNITCDDICKYNIGYCNGGKYDETILLPSYDASGKLNYFTARSYKKDVYSKYINPDTSRDVIINEHLINWELPVILCEGIFDAIAIKRNAIPLLGKTIQHSLMKKLISSKVKQIYIALDKDAIKHSLDLCELLMNEGKKVYFVDMDTKDPSELGFKKFTDLVQTSSPLSFYEFMEKKLQLI